MVIRNSPHRAPLLGILRKHHQTDDQESGHNRRNNIQIINKEPIAQRLVGRTFKPDVHPLRQTRAFRRTDIQRLDVGPPHQVGHPLKEICQTDGRHKQDDRLLADQMPEHKPLHEHRQQHHDPDRQNDRKGRMHGPSEIVNIRAKDRVDQMRKRHLPVLDTHQRHRRKQRHDPLGKIENPRRLVDQHETQRDQRIKHPRHQPVGKDLNRISQLLVHERASFKCCTAARYAVCTPGVRCVTFNVPLRSVMCHPQIGINHCLIVAHF